jgi:hypothetical protein
MSERRFPYPIHPMALLFPPKTEEEMSVIKSNMVCRQEQGLPPIHDPIQLLDNHVLDGRHRQQAWKELAEEGACGGFFAKEEPPITVVTGDTLKAWLVVESGNLCHRHLPPDRKTAILLKAAEDYPEVGERIEEIRKANDRRMKSGQPSRTGTEGSSTAATIGRMVGVSASTVETVQRVQRDAPQEFQKVVTGEVRAKSVVKGLRKKKTAPATLPASSASESQRLREDMPHAARFLTKSGENMALFEWSEADLKQLSLGVKQVADALKVIADLIDSFSPANTTIRRK